LALRPDWDGSLFTYASGRPTSLIDPSGLDPNDDPEPVPLPAAGTLDEKLQRCQTGWEDCRDRLRWEVIADSNGALTPFEAGAVCNDFKTMCEEKVRGEGSRGVFEIDKAEKRMRAIFESSQSLLEQLIDSLPRIRLPSTGSGGLESKSKEGRSFWLCNW
jgi:hypothetical protein